MSTAKKPRHSLDNIATALFATATVSAMLMAVLAVTDAPTGPALPALLAGTFLAWLAVRALVELHTIATTIKRKRRP